MVVKMELKDIEIKTLETLTHAEILEDRNKRSMSKDEKKNLNHLKEKYPIEHKRIWMVMDLKIGG